VSLTDVVPPPTQTPDPSRGAALYSRTGHPVGASDSEIVNHCMSLFTRARDHRRPLVQQWLRNYSVLHNRFSGIPGRALRSPEPPEIKPIIAALVSWETDTEPIFDALPEANPYSPAYDLYNDLAQTLALCLQSGWKQTNVDAEVERVLWDGMTYGIGVVKTTWDQSIHSGLGDFSIKRTDPFSFFVDPSARSMDDAYFFVEVQQLSYQECLKRWPDAADRIPLGSLTRTDGDQAPNRLLASLGAQPSRANSGAVAPSTNATWGLPGQTRDSLFNDPGITIHEFWLRENVTAPAPTPTPDGNPMQTDTERTYDSWRCIIIAGGTTVVSNEPVSSYWSTNTHPYDRYVPEDTGEFYSDSLVELMTGVQLYINRNLASLIQNLDLTGNPVLRESTASMIPRSQIPTTPGGRLQMKTTAVGNEVSWMDPPTLPPEFMQIVQWLTSRMESISGLSAIVRGATPTGRNAEGVLDAVSEAAFVRIRNNLRNLERCLRGAGNKAASYICEFYDEPRVVALSGTGGERTAQMLRGLDFYVPTPEGRIPLGFIVNIDLRSQQATSRQARFQQGMTMFTTGALDLEGLLEFIQFPNYKDVVARIREFQAQNQQLAAAAPARQAAGRTT
jgi:hypothetical protein